MIPTTVTSSTSPATAGGNSNNNHSGSNNGTQNSSSSMLIGIASLILEGRAIAEDEYYQQQHQRHLQPLAAAASGSSSSGGGHVGSSTGSGSFYIGAGGQQSPKPSTSRAATSSASSIGGGGGGHAINITTNPQALHTTLSLYIDGSSGSAACSPAESTRQRLSQKLCQLRQASPTVSLSAPYEQSVAIEAQNASAIDSDLVTLALVSTIDDLELRHRVIDDHELRQRVSLSRPSVSSAAAAATGSASSSPGSENFLHSLQSLATTCLRGGSPPMEHSSYRYPTMCASPVSPPLLATASPKYTTYRATPPRYPSPYVLDVPGSGSSNGSGVQSPRLNWFSPITGSGSSASNTADNMNYLFERQVLLQRHTSGAAMRLSNLNPAAAAVASTANEITNRGAAATATATTAASCTVPQQGPHCDQFLRKMGLAKGEAAEPSEDHICDMSYVNITCSRWRAHCLKMEAIMARGEPICIEVYLGPVGHKILLEQWIITQNDKVPPPTMTLPSLCSAIRSQLYFSQISAWCDLIKKSDKTIYDTGRIIFPTPTGAAGDLATSAASGTGSPSSSVTPGTSPGSAAASPPPLGSHQLTLAMLQRRPRLNIFYRIKQYDSTACFNSKPNVHNFPNVNITENCSISVCLKSLPRINGGIPKVGTAMPTTGELSTNGAAAASTSTSGSSSSSNGAAASSTSLLDTTPKTSRCASSNCDTKPPARAAAAPAAVATPLTAHTATDVLGGAAAPPYAACVPDSGAQKCKFFIDEEELLSTSYCRDAGDGDGGAADDDDDDSISDHTTGAGLDSSNSSFSSNANLSHRERQLLKYRKRMLKRDKKHHQRKALCHSSEAASAELQQQQQRRRERSNGEHASAAAPPTCQPMEQSEEETHTAATSVTRLRATHIEMISTGTQTPMVACCQQCGSEKAFICLMCSGGNVDGGDLLIDADEMSSSSSISSADIIHSPRNNAELLLQAIQRTPNAAKHKKKSSLSSQQPLAPAAATLPQAVAAASPQSQNNNHVNMPSPSPSGMGPGCQVCKRQKTQHNFGARADAADTEELVADEEDDEADGKGGVLESAAVAASSAATAAVAAATTQLMEEEEELQLQESYMTSTKLTPHLDRCALSSRSGTSLSSKQNVASELTNGAADAAAQEARSRTPPNVELVKLESNSAQQFRTPPNQQQQQSHSQQQPPFPHKQTPKPQLLQLTCSYQNGGAGGDYSSCLAATHGYAGGAVTTTTPPPAHHNPLLLRKGLPKVNLTPIFCNPTAAATTSGALVSSPIPISSAPAQSNAFSFDASATTTLYSSSSAPAVIVCLENNNIPVQKSFSAPTLPNSPSLSPRFAKQAAIYKRRSRHLSDRSDRSSLGSDEQFSDEELELGGSSSMFSPASSPLKQRTRIAAAFGRLPLLGNLEEALLQRRIMPKVEVLGFKVLLGASGGFCPTQLTIPAAAFFYELHGETLSTPYVCDIRLPRKGYSVPRAGTVQATLLNPMGTVVRMFVIPYDMRDMPPLHQTFIRQRILAEASANETITLQANSGEVKHQVDLHNGGGGGDTLMAPASNYNNNNNNSCNNNNNDIDGHANNSTNIGKNSNSINNNNNKYRLSPSGGLHGESNLGHFISAEHMKRLRYSIHLRFQTTRSGRLTLHTDIRLLISRRTDCDTAAAHAKGALEAPNDLVTDTVMPTCPKYSARQENPSKI